MALGVDDALAIAGASTQAVGTIGSLFGGNYSHHNERAAKRLYDYQQKKQLEYNKKTLEEYTKPYYTWQKMNDAQLEVAGLKRAGINPLSVFGNGGLPQGADSLQASDAPDTVSGLMSAGVNQDTLGLQKMIALADVGKTLAETKNIKAQTKGQQTFNEFARDLYQGQAKSAQGNAILVDEQVKLTRAQAREVYSHTAQMDAETTNIKELTQNIKAQYDLLVQQKKINVKTLKNISADTSLKLARVAREQFGLTLDHKQLEQMSQAITYMIQQGDALLPSRLFGQYLMSNGEDADAYFRGQTALTISNGENGGITAAVRSGQLYDFVVDNVNKATKGKSGLKKGVAGAAAFGQSFLTIMTQNLGSALGALISLGAK